MNEEEEREGERPEPEEEENRLILPVITCFKCGHKWIPRKAIGNTCSVCKYCQTCKRSKAACKCIKRKRE
jgi:hypothetical protein